VIEPFVPGLVPGGDQITIRQLLQHTSGLPDFEDDPRYLEPYLSGDYGHYWSPRQLVEMALSHPVRFPPGRTEITSYSNTNYVLLGMIVEAVTGRPIGDVLEQRLFRPLHLSDTSYPTEPGLPEPYAHGYLSLGGPPIDVTGLSPSLSPASGAIVATAVDVADFYRALLAGRILPRRLLTVMKTTMSEGDHVDIPGQRYGLGLEMFPTRCGPAWGHNGVVPGYFTFVYSTEDGSRQALLFVNHDSSSLPQAAADRFFPLIEDAFCSAARR
jgi:D-alanyl-D-alanine carboxypeptidase